MATINSVSIIKKAQSAINAGAKSNEIKKTLYNKGTTAGKDLAKTLEQVLDVHPVTKELQRDAKSNSSFLSYGNIKAYFGLSDARATGDISIIRGLMGNFTVKVTKETGSANYKINITFPKIENYYNVTPPPNESYDTSWLRALELGLLQNFGHFLFRRRGFPRANSRSSTGIQVENTIRSGGLNTVPPIKYITDVYKDVLGDKRFIRAILKNRIQ